MIRHKVRLKREDDAVSIIKVLLTDGNFKNRISIKGNIAKIEIFSDEEVLPKAILKTIYASEAEEKAKKVLESLAKKAVSFEQFITLLEDYFKIGTNFKGIFEDLVTIATEVDKIIWKNLNVELSKKRGFYDEWVINKLSTHISKKCSVTMLPFLELIKRISEKYFGDTTRKLKTNKRNMNKLQENVTLRDTTAGERIIKAYFRNCNPESSISIEGNKAEIEIFFSGETPPEAMTKEIDNCKKYERVTKKLKQMAEEATCFEDFIIASEESLEIGDNPAQDRLFRKLVMASRKIDNITWKNLEVEARNYGRTYTDYERVKLRDHVSKKTSVTILFILEEIKKYWEQYFRNEELFIEQEEVVKKTKNKSHKTIVKEVTGMKYILSTPSFEEALASIDRSKSMEERVQYVFEKMNWGRDSLTFEEQGRIVDFVSHAIRKPEINLDGTFTEMKTPEEERLNIIITFTLLINTYVKKNNPECNSVPIETFLSELRDVIL